MMKGQKIQKGIFNILILLCGVFLALFISAVAVRAEEITSDQKLKNGSFEEGQTWTATYSQLDQSAVPSWNTTAFQGKIELFRENYGTYIPGVTLKPTDGKYAAELNADEESTLYQNVKTLPSSIYKWGLDHGARNGTDTMALIIGPKQANNPSKPSKGGRDQLMQMVDWLIDQGKTSVKIKTEAGLGEQLVLYSKKFGAAGTFEDNADDNAFSLTPSSIYTEEWHIWIIADNKGTNENNTWGKYGSNSTNENTDQSDDNTGQSLDLSQYYLYTVPSGQTETLFGFVSVGFVDSPVSYEKAKTYGNFLDNINFELYHPLSASTTTHGSAVIGGSDGSVEGEGSSSGYPISVDNKLVTYVTDGEPLKVQAVVSQEDSEDGCEFVGLYYTKQNDDGNAETVFLKTSGNIIDETDAGKLTDEEKKEKWIRSVNTNGDVIFTCYLSNVTSATALHLIFIKSPTVTYDPNGGQAYIVNRTYNTDEAGNVYSFKPVANGTDFVFISPYVSESAKAPEDGWKFIGWKLTGDTVSEESAGEFTPINAELLGNYILPAEHTIACDYVVKSASTEVPAQYFKILAGNVSMEESDIGSGGQKTGVSWNAGEGNEILYANMHKGLTLVAQWRWLQTFIPQLESAEGYATSDEGGTVEIIGIKKEDNENYNDSIEDAPGAKSYYADTNEIITVQATANPGFTFEGWFDGNNKLITTKSEYRYVETKEKITTLYARFSGSVTQTYVRQVKNGDGWVDTTDDNIGKLDRYSYDDKIGSSISSTATEGSDYKFVGWYDNEGNKVADNMLANDGYTIKYQTTENATYYARFEKAVKQTFIRQLKNGDNWDLITDYAIATLSLYEHTDIAGKEVESKASSGTEYEFAGWYDVNGKLVPDSMLKDDGKTIYYTTADNATYYARFAQKKYTVNFVAQTKQDDGSFVTDNAGGTVAKSSASDVNNTDVSSEASANDGYKFIGWYDADGNILSGNTTYSTTITSSTDNITYFARFEKLIKQQFVRQLQNGETWNPITDDAIAALSLYEHTDIAGKEVESKASSGTEYEFAGWYDANGKLVPDNMLKDDGKTIYYTTADNATYYARFAQKKYTVNFVAQTKQDDGSFATDNAGGSVSKSSVSGVNNTDVSSEASANDGYKFIGWYDADGNILSESTAYSTITTSGTDGVVYYARFEKIVVPEDKPGTGDPKPSDPKPSQSKADESTSSNENTSKIENADISTGDSNAVGVYATLFVLSFVTIVLILFGRRKI